MFKNYTDCLLNNKTILRSQILMIMQMKTKHNII